MSDTKPLIATTLKGLYVASYSWQNAHLRWFATAARELQDPSIADYANAHDWFPLVDQVMQRLRPDLSEKLRTTAARDRYFRAVVEDLRSHPEYICRDIAEYIASLKSENRIALVTSTTPDPTQKIMRIAGIANLFDIVETSFPHEKDDKPAVMRRLIADHGRPIVYVGSGRQTVYEFCRENRIPYVLAALENQDEIPGVSIARTIGELDQFLKDLSKINITLFNRADTS